MNETGQSTDLPPLPSQSHSKILLMGAVILLCGIAIGSGGTMLLTQKPASYDDMKCRSAKELATSYREKFDLSEEQNRQVEDILNVHLPELEKIRQETQEKMETVHEDLRGDLKQVLDDRQFARWEKSMQRHSRHFGRKSRKNRSRRRSNSMLFRYFDKNRDAGLDREELLAILQADGDGDALVTEQELIAYQRKQKKKCVEDDR